MHERAVGPTPQPRGTPEPWQGRPGAHTALELGDWAAADDRPDPVALIDAQNATREPDLVPVRHGRMMVSPFTFYRGGREGHGRRPRARARVRASRCRSAATPISRTSACTPRPNGRSSFDLNDFDETLPGPVRVRRRATGGELRDRRPQQRLLGRPRRGAWRRASVAAYRTAMQEFARMRDARRLVRPARRRAPCSPRWRRPARRPSARPPPGAGRCCRRRRTKDSLQALSKLTEARRRRASHRERPAGRHPGTRPDGARSASPPTRWRAPATDSCAPTDRP